MKQPDLKKPKIDIENIDKSSDESQDRLRVKKKKNNRKNNELLTDSEYSQRSDKQYVDSEEFERIIKEMNKELKGIRMAIQEERIFGTTQTANMIQSLRQEILKTIQNQEDEIQATKEDLLIG